MLTKLDAMTPTTSESPNDLRSAPAIPGGCVRGSTRLSAGGTSSAANVPASAKRKQETLSTWKSQVS